MKRKMVSILLVMMLCFGMVIGVSASPYTNFAVDEFGYLAESDPQEIEEYILLDEADLLTDQEEAELTEKLQNVSQKYNAQLVISTLPSIEGGDIDECIEYLYDTLGLGYGENQDGVLLLVSMDPREFRILANGYAGKAIDEDTGNAIGDAFSSELTSGNYAKAFGIFADKCQYYLDGHLNGFPFDLGKNLVIALVIGIVIGLIVAFVLKGQLKSVRKKEEANVYVRPGSMQLTTSNDFFLYRTIDRRKKESSSSNSSGSSRSVSGGSF